MRDAAGAALGGRPGPISRKAGQAPIPAPRASWLVPKGFRRPRRCLGFLLQEGGRRAGRVRGGDIVASNENAFCKEIARVARVERWSDRDRLTQVFRPPPPHPTRCLSACVNVSMVSIDFLKARWQRLRACTQIDTNTDTQAHTESHTDPPSTHNTHTPNITDPPSTHPSKESDDL